jgi:RNA polymerase sigma-70 factor (ECF subfamily)
VETQDLLGSTPTHLATLSDARLVALAQAGHKSALEELLVRHGASIERLCRRLCKDEAQAEDVIQETYVAILRNIHAFRGEAGFLTWVYTIARTHRGRATRTLARDRGRQETLSRLADVAYPGRPGPDDVVAGREVTTAFARALAPLAPVDREIVVMRDVEGRSAAEIASELGLTVPAVKTRLHRARVFVRSQLCTLRRMAA